MDAHADSVLDGESLFRPRILFIVEHVPFVPSGGGTTRTFNLVQAACELGPTTLISLWGDPADSRYAAIARLCESMKIVAPFFSPTSAPAATVARRQSLKGALVGLVVKFPAMQRRVRATVRWLLCREVRKRLRVQSYDLVVVEYTDLAAALCGVLRRWGGPAVANLQNVDSVVRERALAVRGLTPGATERRLLKQVRRWEQRLLRFYSLVQVCSDVDVELLAGTARDGRVAVVPNGVDISYFAAPVQPKLLPECTGKPLVVFTGTLAHQPNVDAIQWFMEMIRPLLLESAPDMQFAIIGAAPVPPSVERYAQVQGVSVHVSVPDVRPYLRAATVSIVPLRVGSGTRLKILDALAARVPVVSTTIGAEGLALHDGTEILLADDPRAFADAVQSIIRQPDLARQLAQAGYDAVCRQFDWGAIRSTFQQQLREVLESRLS